MRILLAVSLAAVTLCACADTGLTSTPRVMNPYPVFRLAPAQIVKLRPGVRADALERLLSAQPPETREWMLDFFVKDSPRERAALFANDPEVDRMIAETWGVERYGRTVREPDPSLQRVAIALAPTLDDSSAGAMIMRRPRSVTIVVRRDHLSPLQIAYAIHALTADTRRGPVPEKGFRRIYVPYRALDSSPGARAVIDEAERRYGVAARTLAEAAPTPVADVGTVPMIQFNPWERLWPDKH